MSYYVRVHGGAHRHRKLLALERALGCSEMEARGLVFTVWCWTTETEPDGELTGWTAADLARVWGWAGDPELMLESLITVGLIDRDDDGMRVHEWLEYAKGWEEAERKRAQRAESKGKKKRPGRGRDAGGTRPRQSRDAGGQAEQSRAEQNRTEQIIREESPAAASPAEPRPDWVIVYHTKGGGQWGLTPELHAALEAEFSGAGIDVHATLLEAATYCAGLEAKHRYTAHGMPAFLRGCLRRQVTFVARQRAQPARPVTENAAQMMARIARETQARERAAAEADPPAQGVLRIAPKSDTYAARAPPAVANLDLFGDAPEAQA